jgi:hypothetical protein
MDNSGLPSDLRAQMSEPILSDFQDVDFRRSFSTRFDAYYVCFEVPYGYESIVSDIGRYRGGIYSL